MNRCIIYIQIIFTILLLIEYYQVEAGRPSEEIANWLQNMENKINDWLKAMGLKTGPEPKDRVEIRDPENLLYTVRPTETPVNMPEETDPSMVGKVFYLKEKTRKKGHLNDDKDNFGNGSNMSKEKFDGEENIRVQDPDRPRPIKKKIKKRKKKNKKKKIHPHIEKFEYDTQTETEPAPTKKPRKIRKKKQPKPRKYEVPSDSITEFPEVNQMLPGRKPVDIIVHIKMNE
ncbi:uncharacterized protein LOC142983604 isoform X2 [Anticarsia gemmatalis]|uniref:uncharacterized protein LOC142983604 isoform X2 n=1 Tax=Anticarsia gemmatalis TaxID=129554 RepID=UPI003F75762C